MTQILKHIGYNSQLLHVLAGDEATKIKLFLEKYAQNFKFDDTHCLVVTYASKPLDVMVQELLKAMDVQVDLPFDKYHWQKKADSYISFLFIEDGSNRKGHMPSEKPSEGHGLTLYEGLWTIAGRDRILDDHAIDMIASRYSIECIPTLYKWDKRIHLSAVCPDVKDIMCGAPIIEHKMRFTFEEWAAITEDAFWQAFYKESFPES